MTFSASDAGPLRTAYKYAGTNGELKRTPLVPHLSHFASLWTSLLLVFTSLKASSAQLDPVESFCRRFGHQTALIDRKLYIDGGFINYNPLSQYPANYSNRGLHYHDLDTPGAGHMPQLYANLTKNSTIPDVNGGTLWADNINKRFYLFAGEYYQQPPLPQFTLWSYDTIYDTWESFGSPPQDDIAAISYGAGVSVSETGEGFYYGGWKSNNTIPGWTGPPKAVSNLVKYDMDSNTWSTDPGPDSIGRAEGAMVFIPIGDGGMLVYFGGVQEPHGNGTWVGQPLDTIFLYDVLSSKWYTQTATGDIPPMRRRFCAGATWAADQSSYNIYLYGGASMPPHTAGFDDVYALSIPSFDWVKLHPPDGNRTGQYPHHSLTCNVVDNAQMIVLGGTFPTLDICDVPTQYGLHNIDMGQQNQEKALWKIFVTNLTKYAVPDPIINAIGGSAGGGATKTAPVDGFHNPDLRILMTRKASIATRTPTRAIPTETGTPEDGDSLSNGAIAGIAVGSAIALLAILFAVVIFIRRRRRKNRTTLTQQKLPTSQPEWSSATYTTTANTPSSPCSPRSPFPDNGPYPYRPSRPVELPVAVDTPPTAGPTLVNPDMTSPAAVSSPGSAEIRTGTGTGSGESQLPRTKVDADGRVWVQVTSHIVEPAASPPLSTTVTKHGYSPGTGSSAGTGGSPGGMLGVHGVGIGLGQYSYAGMEEAQQQQQHQHASEPQELPINEPTGGASGRRGRERPLGDSAGWDAAHGRPRHLTYYNP